MVININLNPTIPPIPRYKDKRNVDVRYTLVVPYVTAHIYWDEKLSELIKISKNIWFFENEPVIIHKIKSTYPKIKIVWIDTTHSRRQLPPNEIYIIQDKWLK